MSAPADESLLAMFREESAERLDRVVDTLLAAERGEMADDAVNSILREVHSIKGAAGMLGLDVAGSIAHAIEEVLADARTSGRLASAAVDPLLRASDALRSAVEGEEVDVETTLTGLETSAGGASNEGPRPGGDHAPAGRRSLRVDAARLDVVVDTVGEAVIHQRGLEHLLEDPATVSPEQLDDSLHRAEVRLDHLQQAVIELRTVPLSSITGAFPRTVRDLATAAGKEVELTVTGAETQMDRVVLEGASEAIGHLLRNAVAHGIEPPEEREQAGKGRCGRVELRARQHGDRVAIEIADDGRGVARDLVDQTGPGKPLARVLAAPGLTRSERPTSLSGRGVGLDAVLQHVQSLGGELDVQTEPGRGTTFTMMLPISLALLHVLLAERGDALFGIPISAVGEVVSAARPLVMGGQSSIEVRGERLSLADPVAVLGGAAAGPLGERSQAVVVTGGGVRAALAFDAVLGDDHALVKPLGRLLDGTLGYLGTAVVGEGRVALILDPAHIGPRAGDEPARVEPAVDESARPAVPAARGVLVVDDQFTAREIQRSILEAAGYRVVTARDGREAWDLLTNGEDVELVVTDLEMPEMDGLTLLRSIRGDSRLSSLPVVVVTSRGSEQDERKGLEAGADAYVVKQRFDQRALLDTVERLISA